MHYRGFRLVWADPPISLAMWAVEIVAEDDERHAKLIRYRDQHGPFAAPVGPLENALEAARKYIDAALIFAG